MNKFWIMLGHTYINKIRSKSMIISTLIMLVFIFGIVNIDKIIEIFDKEEVSKVVVLDSTGDLYKELTDQIQDDSIELILAENEKTEIEEQILAGEIEGMVEVNLQNGLPTATYYSESITNEEVFNTIDQALNQVKVKLATNQLGIGEDEVSSIFAPVPFKKVALGENAKTEAEVGQAIAIVYFILFLIYIFVVQYAAIIATEVATEKSSRVMEILVSSASPIQQMFAKILGIGLVSITQLLVLMTAGILSARNLVSQVSDQFSLSDLPFDIFIYGMIFFILGFLLYATLAAFLGALVSRTEDVQQVISPMMFLIVAAFIIAMTGIQNPESTFISVLSFIPFFSPMLMFLRVGMLSIPLWEIALSIGLLVGTIIILAIYGAKIYKGGVLMYRSTGVWKGIKEAMTISKES
ncbi:ABC transporter permease [Bacillus carboniphilus]|uniref:ABC transporter permease n=1 Tax=Bacillus carboniphilus TaxID=86663 RepID=A0ABY9JVR0_9BACI|nr:ABC transporter permease [Bacillus carboniphilus]WLR42833.1 ABC transporter permease [Bacillus carboniphilus]